MLCCFCKCCLMHVLALLFFVHVHFVIVFFFIINVLFEFEMIRVLLVYKLLCLRSYVVHWFF